MVPPTLLAFSSIWVIPREFPRATIVSLTLTIVINMDTTACTAECIRNIVLSMAKMWDSLGGNPAIMQSFARMMVLDEAGEDQALGIDPQGLDMVIKDTGVKIHEVIEKAQLCEIACKDMASYVCESKELLEDIERSLEEGSTEKLTHFLDEMRDYLQECQSSLEQFTTSETKLRSDLKQIYDLWSGEAMKRAAEERKSLYVSRGSGAMAVALGGGGAITAATASSIVCPPVAIFLAAMLMFGASAGSGALASAFASERVMSKEKKKVFVEALKRAVKYYEQLADIKILIGGMETNMCAARRYLGGATRYGTRKGLAELVEQAASSGCLHKNIARMKSDLSRLRELMKKILTAECRYLEM